MAGDRRRVAAVLAHLHPASRPPAGVRQDWVELELGPWRKCAGDGSLLDARHAARLLARAPAAPRSPRVAPRAGSAPPERAGAGRGRDADPPVDHASPDAGLPGA